MLAPGLDRVGLVEAAAELDELPEPVEIGLAEHLLGPAGVRDADDRPVVELLVDLAAVQLRDLLHARLADPRAGEVAEQVWLRVAGQRDDRRAFVTHALRSLEQPGRRPREHVVVAVLDQRPPDVRVAVGEVDVPRSGAVCGARDGSGDVEVLDVGPDVDELARLHVGADADDELGVALEAAVGL